MYCKTFQNLQSILHHDIMTTIHQSSSSKTLLLTFRIQKNQVRCWSCNWRSRSSNDNPTVENQAQDVPDIVSKFQDNRTTDDPRSGSIFETSPRKTWMKNIFGNPLNSLYLSLKLTNINFLKNHKKYLAIEIYLVFKLL